MSCGPSFGMVSVSMCPVVSVSIWRARSSRFRDGSVSSELRTASSRSRSLNGFNSTPADVILAKADLRKYCWRLDAVEVPLGQAVPLAHEGQGLLALDHRDALGQVDAGVPVAAVADLGVSCSRHDRRQTVTPPIASLMR